MEITDQNGNQITAEVPDDVIVGEVIQSAEGYYYEVTEIAEDEITVELVEVEEDWGE